MCSKLRRRIPGGNLPPRRLSVSLYSEAVLSDIGQIRRVSQNITL